MKLFAKEEDRAGTIGLAADVLLEEMRRGANGDRNISLAYAAHYLRQHGMIHGRCPYSTGGKYELRWCYQIAQAALGRLVRSGKAQTFWGCGERKAEIRKYEPAEG